LVLLLWAEQWQPQPVAAEVAEAALHLPIRSKNKIFFYSLYFLTGY
jgi:hypothetical protein